VRKGVPKLPKPPQQLLELALFVFALCIIGWAVISIIMLTNP